MADRQLLKPGVSRPVVHTWEACLARQMLAVVGQGVRTTEGTVAVPAHSGLPMRTCMPALQYQGGQMSQPPIRFTWLLMRMVNSFGAASHCTESISSLKCGLFEDYFSPASVSVSKHALSSRVTIETRATFHLVLTGVSSVRGSALHTPAVKDQH
ncbi:hypothetical protein BaRGS_00025017 [Batillaria attramentaria]|uniref:Uncharacterized protein n=1 Tax=Batillaria attramentaria TaxID=370345 RepID=A0ABD0K9S8_9CAEN